MLAAVTLGVDLIAGVGTSEDPSVEAVCPSDCGMGINVAEEGEAKPLQCGASRRRDKIEMQCSESVVFPPG